LLSPVVSSIVGLISINVLDDVTQYPTNGTATPASARDGADRLAFRLERDAGETSQDTLKRNKT
jgi:hypothetical protein